MPRSRNIKPSLFKNELLGEADPILTIVFIGLWTLADREGRLEDRPKRIKAEILPYRECRDFNGYLTELARLGFIHRYAVEDCAYIQVVNFKKHQAPHKTEKPSEIPEPPAESVSCSSTVKAPLSNGSDHVKESLIPDSLIPDSCNGGADAPARKKPWGDPPESVDETAWTEWTAYKGGKPKKATVTKLANLLAKHSPEVQRKAVEHSIANGYAGLFPEKFANEKPSGSGGRVFESGAEARRRQLEEQLAAAEGVEAADGDVRGQILEGVWERAE